jgi:hypothetical protein
MMTAKRWIPVAAVVALVLSGCGRSGPPATPEGRGGQAAEVPLPEWAPENPSPEFLRAARVLKPVPPEHEQRQAGDDPAGQAWYMRYRRTYLASYEFFGTLGDEQMARFLSEKKLLIRVQALTSKQRVAMDRWMEARREAMRGVGPESEDFLVNLFKLGAREDLSNVQVGFIASGGHAVHVLFCVTQSGDKQDGICCSFAVI